MEEVIGSIPIRSTKSSQSVTGDFWEHFLPIWEQRGNKVCLPGHR